MKLLVLDSQAPASALFQSLADRKDIEVIGAGPGGVDATHRDRYHVLEFESLPGVESSLPSLSSLASAIAQLQPDACLLHGHPPFVRLVRAFLDSADMPVLQVVDSRAQLGEMTRVAKSRSDLFFIADPQLLPDVLRDERYGSTVLPIGDLLDSDRRAATDRLVHFLFAWRDGTLPSTAPTVSIVVPAYKESANLNLVCERLLAMISTSGTEAEIILVDDASPDDTYAAGLRAMMLSPRIRAFTKPLPRGMGNAIRYGIDRARTDIVTVTMGDGSDDVDRIPAMVREVAENGNALAIGCRYRHAENFAAIPGMYRFWSRTFRLVTRIVIGLRLTDYTNSFRTYRLSSLGRLGLESGGFEISPEVTFKAWFATRRIAEVDVKHLKRASGQSKFSFLRAGPGYGKILLKAVITRVTGHWFVLDW